MELELQVKEFAQLTVDQLHAIYKLRSQVFVVEQQCIYADVDDWDKVAVHVMLVTPGADLPDGLQGYLRVLPAGTQFDQVGMGRVIAVPRRQGVGTALVQAGVQVARERFGAQRVVLEAQVYARGLYEKQGFRAVGEEFLEDGIPHIRMELEL